MGTPHSMRYAPSLIECKPRQGNGYDCGVFMFHYMRKINRFMRCQEEDVLLEDFIKDLCSGLISAMFTKMRQSILHFMLGEESIAFRSFSAL